MTSLLALALVSRLLVALVGAWALRTFPLWGDGTGWSRGSPLVVPLARWDSAYYMGIAEVGRGYVVETWNFPPGYPLALRGTKALLPTLEWADAGALVSFVAFLACVPLLYTLTLRHFDARVAWRATALFTLLPATLWASAVYADGLFLALVLACFVAMHARHWLVAGALASLAAITRPYGLLLAPVIVLALVLARRRGEPVAPLAWLAPGLALVAPLVDSWVTRDGTGGLLGQHETREAVWSAVGWRNPLTPWNWPSPHTDTFVFAVAGYVLALAALSWAARDAWRRGEDAPLAVYAFSALVVVLMVAYADTTPSLRYSLCIVAVPWALAHWTARSPALFLGVAVACAAALATVTAFFALWWPLW